MIIISGFKPLSADFGFIFDIAMLSAVIRMTNA